MIGLMSDSARSRKPRDDLGLQQRCVPGVRLDLQVRRRGFEPPARPLFDGHLSRGRIEERASGQLGLGDGKPALGIHLARERRRCRTEAGEPALGERLERGAGQVPRVGPLDLSKAMSVFVVSTPSCASSMTSMSHLFQQCA